MTRKKLKRSTSCGPNFGKTLLWIPFLASMKTRSLALEHMELDHPSPLRCRLQVKWSKRNWRCRTLHCHSTRVLTVREPTLTIRKIRKIREPHNKQPQSLPPSNSWVSSSTTSLRITSISATRKLCSWTSSSTMRPWAKTASTQFPWLFMWRKAWKTLNSRGSSSTISRRRKKSKSRGNWETRLKKKERKSLHFPRAQERTYGSLSQVRTPTEVRESPCSKSSMKSRAWSLSRLPTRNVPVLCRSTSIILSWSTRESLTSVCTLSWAQSTVTWRVISTKMVILGQVAESSHSKTCQTGWST